MEKARGKFYIVSTGPGDPELMTVKAIRVLESCPVIAAPQTGRRALALEIAGQAVDLSEKEILHVHFSMSEDQEILWQNYREIADRIRGILDGGRDTAMLALGDVSIYSTGNYIHDLIRQMGYETEIIPGVPSFCAVAAVLETSLAEGGSPLHVIPAGQMDLEEALKLTGTKILMKSGSHMQETIKTLEDHHLLEHAAMVTDCALSTQKIYRDLSAVPEDVSYFATICVKDPDKKEGSR